MKEVRKFIPGTVVSFRQGYKKSLGVVVDTSFFEWVMGQDKLNWPVKFDSTKHCALRVLGVFIGSNFSAYDIAEPDEHVIVHYTFEKLHSVEAIDLREIAFINDDVLRLFIENEYDLLALHDARVLYEYLDGVRFVGVVGSLTKRREKLLQLLEKAIPLG
ncbi:MAG: hypothetical protein WCF93_01655 [Candidatus Moraniibacteriota bacterium]